MTEESGMLRIRHEDLEASSSKTAADRPGRRGRPRILSASPELYEIHREDYPRLKPADAAAALQTLLPTLLPGNREDYAFDIRTCRLPEGGCRGVAVIMARENLDAIRAGWPGVPIAVPAAAAMLRGETGTVRFRFAGDTDVFSLDENTASPLSDEGLRPRLIEWSTRDKDLLYFADADRRRFRRRFAFLTAAAVLFGAVALAGGYRLHSERQGLSHLERSTRNDRETAAEAAAVAEDRDALLQEAAALRNAAPVSAYGLLSAVLAALPADTRLSSVVAKGETFTLRGETADGLAAIRSLESSPHVDELKLQQLIPRDDGDAERFVISGRFHGR